MAAAGRSLAAPVGAPSFVMRIWLRHHAVRHHHTSPRSHRSQFNAYRAHRHGSDRSRHRPPDRLTDGALTGHRTRTVSQVTVSTLSIRYGSAGRCPQSTQVEVLSSRISFLRAHTIMLFIARSVCASVGAPEGGAPPGPPSKQRRRPALARRALARLSRFGTSPRVTTHDGHVRIVFRPGPRPAHSHGSRRRVS